MNTNESIRLIDGRRMQCKDIPDELYLDAVRATTTSTWTTRQRVKEVVEVAVGSVPDNLLTAKTRRLIQRGLLDGCGCGCRGDLSIPDERRGTAGRVAPPSDDDGAPETAPSYAGTALPAAWSQYPWWITPA